MLSGDIEPDVAEAMQERVLQKQAALDSRDYFDYFPRGGPERIAQVEEYLLDECQVDKSLLEGRGSLPIETVDDVVVSALSKEVSNDLHLPRIGRLSDCDSYELRYRELVLSEVFDSPYRPEDHDALIARLNTRLKHSDPGTVSISEDSLTIRLGQRRAAHHSQGDIALLFYLASREHPFEYYPQIKPTPRFFSSVIEPWIRQQTSSDPFSWGMHASSIYSSISIQTYGDRMPLEVCMHPCMVVAGVAANTFPERLSGERAYQLKQDQKSLLKDMGANISPERAYLVAELGSEGYKAFVSTPLFERWQSNLSDYLNRGLSIDRVVEAIRQLNANGGVSLIEAVESIQAITHTLFGSQQRAWWFHEDQPLIPQTFSNGSTLKDHLCLAERTGQSYQYAKDIWERGAVRLVNEGLLDRSQAYQMVDVVTNAYGIGNVGRAVTIINSVREALTESPPGSRGGELALLLEALEAHKPFNEIIGALEGSDVGFSMPGLPLILNSLEVARIPTELDIHVEDLRTLEQHFARPLSERAAFRPELAIPYERAPLVTDWSDYQLIRLPIQDSPPQLARGAFQGWVRFDAQLRNEVDHDRDKIARRYFALFANKMPDPFCPPPGFLRFMSEFSKLPDPEWKFSALEAPGRRRQAVEQENATSNLDRWQTIANIVDCVVLDMISWDDFTKLTKWLLVKPSQDDIRELEMEALWRWEEARYDRLSDTVEYAFYKYQRELIWKEFDLAKELSDADSSRSGSQWQLETRLDEVRAKIANPEAAFRQEYYSGDEPIFSYREKTPEDLLERDDPAELDHLLEIRGRSSLKNAERNSRLQVLADSFSQIQWLVTLCGSGVVKDFPLGPVVRNELERLMEGKSYEEGRGVVRDRHQLAKDLRQASELELLDIDKIIASLRGTDDHAEIIKRANALLAVPETLARMRKLIKHHISHAIPYRSDGEINLPAVRARESLIADLREAFRDPSVYTPRAAEIYFARNYWPDRYQIVLPRARLLLKELEQGEDIQAKPQWQGALNQCRELLCASHVMAHPTSSPERISQHSHLLLPSHALETDGETLTLSPANQVESAVMTALRMDYSRLRETIALWRQESFGLLPIGGKIHVLHKIDLDRFEFLRDQLGLSSTHFRLIHADTSLLLAPMPSWKELAFLTMMLAKEEIIDLDHPEIQMCVGGRLPRDLCAILGSSVLLDTDRGVKYSPKAFETTHNGDTRFNVMFYDANGPRSSFPFEANSGGRTDMQGRRSLNDLKTYQLVSTVLYQGHATRGPFAHLAEPYCRRVRSILGDYGLSSVLAHSWIDSELNHQLHTDYDLKFTVLPLVNAWFDYQNRFTETGQTNGIVFDIRTAVDSLGDDVRVIQDEMLKDPRYEAERLALFGRSV